VVVAVFAAVGGDGVAGAGCAPPQALSAATRATPVAEDGSFARRARRAAEDRRRPRPMGKMKSRTVMLLESMVAALLGSTLERMPAPSIDAAEPLR
jgi:hypothetical protein